MPQHPAPSPSTSRWYIGRLDAWAGPKTSDEIRKDIEEGSLSWADHVWSPGMEKAWVRLCDLPEFRQQMPAAPQDDLISEIEDTWLLSLQAKTPPPEPPRRSVWFLRFQGSEFGPLTPDEVRVIIKSGKLEGELFAWKEGLPEWTPLQNLPDLNVARSEPQKGAPQEPPGSKRKSRRAPLVATIRYTMSGDNRSGAIRFTGVCRDLSIQGMLILGKSVPGYPGALFRMEVEPDSGTGLETFSTEAQVVRILPDHQGFSVRFRNLDTRTQAKIRAYLAKVE